MGHGQRLKWSARSASNAYTAVDADFGPSNRPLAHGLELELMRPDGRAVEVDIFSADGYRLWISEADRFPPLVTARAMLGERFGVLRERLIDVWGEFNEAEDGSFSLPQEYLLSTVRL